MWDALGDELSRWKYFHWKPKNHVGDETFMRGMWQGLRGSNLRQECGYLGVMPIPALYGTPPISLCTFQSFNNFKVTSIGVLTGLHSSMLKCLKTSLM